MVINYTSALFSTFLLFCYDVTDVCIYTVTMFADMFIIYCNIKSHKFASNGLLLITIKLKVKYILHDITF